MKDLTKVSIDLEKCTEEQRKHVISLLPEPEYDHQYLINNDNFILHFLGDRWWVINFRSEHKEELTYTEFIKLFEGEKDNNGWIKIESESDFPKDLIDNGTEVWLSRNKIPFIGYFYRSYDGLNYAVHNLDSTPKEIKGIHMGSFKSLDGYQPIQKPEPPKF